MLKVVKLFFVTFMTLISTFTYASTYDNDILNTFSKLSPRFILMSTQEEQVQGTLNICLVHNEIDEKVADNFIEMIEKNYPDGIKSYPIKVIKSSNAVFEVCEKSQLIFLFTAEDNLVSKTILYAEKNRILTIAYDSKLLESGADISLHIGRKVIPYLNLNSLKRKNIQLNNLLLRISKIYISDGEQNR